MVTLLGNVVITSAFAFLGPLPCINMEPHANVIQGMAFLVGFGFGMVFCSAFGIVQATAIKSGYEDDIKTYLMISGNQIKRIK